MHRARDDASVQRDTSAARVSRAKSEMHSECVRMNNYRLILFGLVWVRERGEQCAQLALHINRVNPRNCMRGNYSAKAEPCRMAIEYRSRARLRRHDDGWFGCPNKPASKNRMSMRKLCAI